MRSRLEDIITGQNSNRQDMLHRVSRRGNPFPTCSHLVHR
jgi:hypothetical protein